MGEEPLDYELHLPDGKTARFFVTDDATYNWRIFE